MFDLSPAPSTETRNYFYVYEHWRSDTNQCFYVGKGQRRRAWDMKLRGTVHRRTIAKLLKSGLVPEVRIVAEGMAESDAFALEVARIALYRGRGHKLANMTNGGQGMGGRKVPEETRAKMRAAAIERNKNPEYIARLVASITAAWARDPDRAKRQGLAMQERIHRPRGPLSTETRAKISAANKGKKHPPMSAEARAKISAACKGRKLSAEHIAKIRIAKLGAKWTEAQKQKIRGRKRDLTAEARARMGDASRGNTYRLGTTHTSEVRARLRKRGLENILTFRQFSHLGPQTQAKRVRCLDDGLEFSSASVAARHYGAPPSSVSQVCAGVKHRKTAGGRHFSYVESA